jgi:2'-5' RNA ligase
VSASGLRVEKVTDTVRAFLSINITDSSILTGIRNLQGLLDRKAAKMKLVEEQNIHFTMRFFGDISLSEADSIESCLDSIVFDTFTIDILGVGAFPSKRKPRVIWIGVGKNADSMVALKDQIDGQLEVIGYRRERPPFTPHATIARVRQTFDRDGLESNLDSLPHTSLGVMRVDMLTLMKSTLTPSGPIYESLWNKAAV